MSSNPYANREDGLGLAVKEEEISVAPEEKVEVHIAVINRSPEEDYFDVSVKGIPADWTTIDTPVVRVASGKAREVTLTIEPPSVPQSRVGRYPLDVRAVSQSDPGRSATARRMLTVAAYESKGRLGVMLGSIHFSIAPGSSIQIPILVQNRGLEEDSFRLNVLGIPANWISTNSVLTRLEPGANKEVVLSIRVPRSPQAEAGRTPFTIQFVSQDAPEQITEVECILTISAFSEFSAALEPETLEASRFGQLILNNNGNTVDTYSLDFQDPVNELIFEKAVQVAKPTSQPGTQQVEIAYVEIPRGERYQVAAGQRGVYPFRARLRSRPLVGGEKTYPYSVGVQSTANQKAEVSARISEKGYVPVWFLATVMVGFLLLCLGLLIPLRGLQAASSATQTAAYNQTQAVLAGGEDTDGDGLTNDEEVALGLDPVVADTDDDLLLDGQEVETYMTNPLVPDTDQDGLLDGPEIQSYQTNPLNPDSDADLLSDGDEIANNTDPLQPDTDQDGLQDGAEISIGTDPLEDDSDRDGLLDGQENQTCPRPLTPDSDGDGIIDGNDLDPCNPSNPSLTATAASGVATQATSVQPTATTVAPTVTLTSAPSSTSPPAATSTPPPPSLQGSLLFTSNRDGNSEIYGLNLASQSITRLTNSSAVDMQAALAPDGVRVAYVTNQDGNNEIYVGGLDRRAPQNLTSNAADDQQPVWSPDGNWIAFTSNRDGNQEIYVMRSDGSDLRNLTQNSANDFAPTWFSVGVLFGSQDWIAFTSTRDGNQEIYKVRADGSGLVNLTRNPANDYSPAGFAGGQVLAFVSERDGNPEIYTMNDNGGAQTNITNSPGQDLDPSMNASGNWIAFSTDREGNLEIYIVGFNGGPAYNLTGNPAQDRQPDW